MFSTNTETFLNLDLGSFVRSLLLVQSLEKSCPTGLLSTVADIFRRKLLTSDTRSQLALFIVNEIRSEGDVDWLQKVIGATI